MGHSKEPKPLRNHDSYHLEQRYVRISYFPGFTFNLYPQNHRWAKCLTDHLIIPLILWMGKLHHRQIKNLAKTHKYVWLCCHQNLGFWTPWTVWPCLFSVSRVYWGKFPHKTQMLYIFHLLWSIKQQIKKQKKQARSKFIQWFTENHIKDQYNIRTPPPIFVLSIHAWCSYS